MLTSILLLAITVKPTNPELINSIFVIADQLVSEHISHLVVITLGVFIPNFKLVVFGAIAVYIAAAIAIQTGIFPYVTIDYLFAMLIVVIGFLAIASANEGCIFSKKTNSTNMAGCYMQRK